MSGHKAIYKSLYFWVILGIVTGIVLGLVPATKGFAESMQPFGTAFIRMVKMIIAPIIFCTVVTGIAKMGDMGKVGRVGIKCMLYFWTMTLFALAIGLVVVNLYKPGAGMDDYAAKMQANQKEIAKVEDFAGKAKKMSTVDFLMNIVPTSVVDAFAKGEILQVLFFSILWHRPGQPRRQGPQHRQDHRRIREGPVQGRPLHHVFRATWRIRGHGLRGRLPGT